MLIKANNSWYVFQINDWKFEHFKTEDEPEHLDLTKIEDEFKYPTIPWHLYETYVPKNSRKYNGITIIKRGEADVGFRIVLENNYHITLLANDDVQEAIQVGKDVPVH